jgi:hypothetical protein
VEARKNICIKNRGKQWKKSWRLAKKIVDKNIGFSKIKMVDFD